MITLRILQEKQIEHDQKYHRDIFFLNYQDRFKHMVMHYGKYSGRFAYLIKTHSDSSLINNDVRRTLVDCFIIVLSVADLLQLKLDEKIKEKLGIEREISVNELSTSLREASPDLFAFLDGDDDMSKLLNLLLEFTTIAGNMLKIGEDLDHMVGFERNSIRDKTLDLLSILLLSGIVWNVNYEQEIPNRWDELAKRTASYGPQ